MEPFSLQKIEEKLGAELPAGTRRALELAYLLSTQEEEGRPLRFAFLLSDHVTFLPERKLQPPVSDPDGIRRLVLATDPGENCWRLKFDESNGSISVTGVASLPDYLPGESGLPPYFH